MSFIILLLFFGVYYYTRSILISSIALTILTLIDLLYKKFTNANIPSFEYVSFIVLLISTILCYFTDNSNFIKMKPTVIYMLFFLSFGFYRFYLGRSVISKFIMSMNIEISKKVDMILSVQWCCFFLLSAILNEFVWRSFSEETWISFKVFIMPLLTFLMLIISLFITKNSL